MVRGATLSLQRSAFSLQWLLLSWDTGSRRAGSESRCTGSRACGLNSDDAQAYLPHAIWDLPGPGIEPMSSALTSKFSTSGPPGKPQNHSLFSFPLEAFLSFLWTSRHMALGALSIPQVDKYNSRPGCRFIKWGVRTLSAACGSFFTG